MHRFLLFLLSAVTLAGCATSRVQTPAPSLIGIKDRVVTVRDSARATRGKVFEAQTNLGAAQVTAGQLAQAVAPDLQPLVIDLQFRLGAAQADLVEATQRVDQVLAQSDAIKAEVDRVQVEVTAVATQRDVAVSQAETCARKLVEANAARSHQTRLAWKWRFIAAGLAAAVAGFFVARQYFPFLKLI